MSRLELLRSFVQELADEDCSYGDECPPTARHYTCLRCKAKHVLELVDRERCTHLSDSDQSSEGLSPEPCKLCGRYFVDD